MLFSVFKFLLNIWTSNTKFKGRSEYFSSKPEIRNQVFERKYILKSFSTKKAKKKHIKCTQNHKRFSSEKSGCILDWILLSNGSERKKYRLTELPTYCTYDLPTEKRFQSLSIQIKWLWFESGFTSDNWNHLDSQGWPTFFPNGPNVGQNSSAGHSFE